MCLSLPLTEAADRLSFLPLILRRPQAVSKDEERGTRDEGSCTQTHHPGLLWSLVKPMARSQIKSETARGKQEPPHPGSPVERGRNDVAPFLGRERWAAALILPEAKGRLSFLTLTLPEASHPSSSRRPKAVSLFCPSS